MATLREHDAAIEKLFQAGFEVQLLVYCSRGVALKNSEVTSRCKVVDENGGERHAAEVALASANGDLDHAATLILSWGGAEPPPLPESRGSFPPVNADPASPAGAETLRLRADPTASSAAGGASASPAPSLDPLPSAGAPASAVRATEAEHRQRVFDKIREQKAKEAKRLRGEAKRRREQEIAIWKEQRDDAKQRKGGGRASGGGASVGGGGEQAQERKESSSAPAERPLQAVVAMRLPDGTSVTGIFPATSTLREVATWLQSNEPSAGKVGGRELELRCPFPPPGRVVFGEELHSTTVEGVGLVPRGRLMVQFSGSTGVKQGKGGMPYGDHNPAVATGRRRGVGRGAGGSRFGGLVDPSGLLPGAVGRGRGSGGTAGRGTGLGVSYGGRGRGWPGGFGGWAVDNEQAEGAEEPDTDGQGIAAGGSEGPSLWGGSASQGEHGIVDGQATGEAGLEHAVPQAQGQVLANDAALGEEDVNDVDGGVEAEGELDEVDGDDFDVPMGGGDGVGDGGGFPPAFAPPGVHIGGPFVPGGVPVMGAGIGPPQPLPPRVVGGGHVLGGGGDELAAAARDATDGQGEGSEDRAAAIREQRLARLTGGGGSGGGGGGEDGSGDGGSGNEGDGGRSRPKAAVGTLQGLLMEFICNRMKSGGHQTSCGSLDGATGERILQRLVEMRALTPAMLAAFRGCPVAALSLDNSPRATNALLAELGRKVSLTSLSVANDDMITVEGVESLVRLRALATLDVSGCKATNGWLKAIAKLPSLQTLILRGCTKVADLGMLSLARGAPALTSLDLTGCTAITDAGIAHLSSLVSRLESFRMEGLPQLSDDGLDALLFDATQKRTGRKVTAPKLRLLSVAKCPGVSNQGLARVGESASASLTELDVSGTSVTEIGLVRLAGGGEEGRGERAGSRRLRLKRLVLPAHGRGVNGLGLGAIVSMADLTLLDLEGCSGPGVTSSALADISRLKRLRMLIVAMVPAFDDDALIAVGGSCHALESLNLNGTSVQRATGLALLGAGLADLALAHTLVDDDSMDAVASLPGLTTLTLRGTRVTGAGVARLSCLAKLRSLNIVGTRAAQEGDGDGLGYAVETLRRGAAALAIRV